MTKIKVLNHILASIMKITAGTATKTRNIQGLSFIGKKLKRKNWIIGKMICHKLEAVVQSCSVKKVFLEISQNSKENTVNFVKFQRTPF